MKPIRVAAVAAPGCLLVLFLVLGALAGMLTLATPGAQAQTPTCIPTAAAPATGAGGGQGAAAGLDPEQRRIVDAIIRIGQQRQLPPRAWQIAIQAGATESDLRNLDYGDRDSVGIFQMRTSQGWGSPAQLQDVTYQINKFYDVLLEIDGWEQMRPGEAAQAVERSAFPDRYHEHEPLAVALVRGAGVPDPAGCTPPPGQVPPVGDIAQRAITYALDKQGHPYVWGAEGPDGYDCSGLTMRAYEAAGISIPRVSRDQYQGAGPQVPISEAQPGDLVFYGYDPSEPATIHHVAIWLGNGRVVEAEQTGVPVHIDTWDMGGAEVMPMAVRPAGAVAP